MIKTTGGGCPNVQHIVGGLASLVWNIRAKPCLYIWTSTHINGPKCCQEFQKKRPNVAKSFTVFIVTVLVSRVCVMGLNGKLLWRALQSRTCKYWIMKHFQLHLISAIVKKRGGPNGGVWCGLHQTGPRNARPQINLLLLVSKGMRFTSSHAFALKMCWHDSFGDTCDTY